MPSAERREKTPAEKAQARTEQELARATRISDLQWLMSDVRGRRYMWCLLEDAGIFRSSFTGDALSSAFMEGERNRGLRMVDELLQHCPKRFSEMQRENLKHAKDDSPQPPAPAAQA